MVTGITRDGVWQFEADQHPVGFFVIVLAKFLALCFCIAVVLHAVGLMAMDPIVGIKQIFVFVAAP